MSKSLNHNHSLQKIENYLTGKMTSAEKHSFEKEALNNSFLQDAIDGYEDSPDALNHFTTKMRPKSNNIFKYGPFAIAFLGIFVVIIYMSNKNTIDSTSNISQTTTTLTELKIINEIEVLPVELETLIVIHSREEIKQQNLATNFNNNPTYDDIKTTQPDLKQTNQKIKEIDITTDEPEEIPSDNNALKVKKIYPFKYFYKMAVVDYTLYDNREKSVSKTAYNFTGVDASKESKMSDNKTQFTEQIIQVSYMDYLEESMWYFTKGKYKNSLKRFDNIASQYKNDYNALFYGGLSNYNLKRFEYALLNFTIIIDLDNGPFYDEALWYRAKTHLKMNNQTAAKLDLENVIINDGFYTKKAIQLLKTF